MKRELWIIANTISNAMSVLNSVRCEDGEEKALTDEDISLIAEQIKNDCSPMMIDTMWDLLELINRRPDGRFCKRTDCKFYVRYGENLATVSIDREAHRKRCSDCIHNEKCICPNLSKDNFGIKDQKWM